MNRFVAGKASVLVLTAVFAVSVFLLGKISTSNVFAVPEEKITICHASGRAGTTKFETLELPSNAVYSNNQGKGGHFNEDGTPSAGHEDDYFGPCAGTQTPTASATPSPTATPTGTTGTTSNTDGAGSGSSQSAGAAGQVLGTSALAKTGGFAETLYLAIIGLGGALTSKAVKGLKKAFKKA